MNVDQQHQELPPSTSAPPSPGGGGWPLGAFGPLRLKTQSLRRGGGSDQDPLVPDVAEAEEYPAPSTEPEVALRERPRSLGVTGTWAGSAAATSRPRPAPRTPARSTTDLPNQLGSTMGSDVVVVPGSAGLPGGLPQLRSQQWQVNYKEAAIFLEVLAVFLPFRTQFERHVSRIEVFPDSG